jgi:hypothetical protein
VKVEAPELQCPTGRPLGDVQQWGYQSPCDTLPITLIIDALHLESVVYFIVDNSKGIFYDCVAVTFLGG